MSQKAPPQNGWEKAPSVKALDWKETHSSTSAMEIKAKRNGQEKGEIRFMDANPEFPSDSFFTEVKLKLIWSGMMTSNTRWDVTN